MNTCRIFGSAPINGVTPKPQNNDLIIAADGGYDSILRLGIAPDIVLGDFDSLVGGYPTGGFGGKIEVIRHPIEKDDTDTGLAVKVGFERGYKSFELYGCLGGERFDHSIATLQTLAFITENGGEGVAIDGDTSVTVIKNGQKAFDPESEGDFSVFAFGGECIGVTIENAKYPLENARLSPSFPLGVSNSFVKGKNARVSVENGTLLIIWKRSDNKNDK